MFPTEILVNGSRAAGEVRTLAVRFMNAHARAAHQFATMKTLTGAREDDGAELLRPVREELKRLQNLVNTMMGGLDDAISDPFEQSANISS